jgi:zinc transporter ZupT
MTGTHSDGEVDGSLSDRLGGQRSQRKRWLLALLPLMVLAGVLAVFFLTSPLAGLQQGEPLPEITVTHTTIPDDSTVVLHVANDGAEAVTISQVLVDDAYWDFEVRGAGGDKTLQPREHARIVVPYHWQPGWDLHVAMITSGGATFGHTIVAANQSPGLDLGLLWTLALIGLFVGVIPVAIGMLWYPAMQRMRDRTLHAILLFAAGLLAFLALDAGVEALEVAERIPGSLEGTALVVLGGLGALLLVQAISVRKEREGGRSGLWVAYLVALGIGLHNLAEGLAIGSSFALGRASLGAFLVIGFMLHNVTEGPAVVAPVARDERPAGWHFLALGVLAGAPVILGGWIGGLAYSPTIGALFLAIGVGAIVQVDWEIVGMVRDAGGRVGTTLNLLAFLAGFAVMYGTDLFVTL